MIEDESGRMHLVGEPLKKTHLVTGIIVGALGMENSNGEFSVVDLCFAGLAPQGEGEGEGDVMEVDADSPEEYIGIISGLDIGPNPSSDAQIQMMIEYLTGEGGGSDDQVSASQISRLIIAGNSLAPIGGSGIDEEAEKERKPRRYGYDYASFSPHPMLNLSAHLLDLARSIPIHLLPGTSDPSGTILPQQPLPRAMFGDASTYSSFNCETNPTYIRLETGISESSAPDNEASSSKRASSSTGSTLTRTILATSGQPMNDMFKYLPTPPATRLGLSESTLRWRHMAPTAPDTLWCHPFFTVDPFVMNQTPDIYIIGDQPRFTSKLVKEGNKRCRIVLVPSFAETGMLVLVGLRTLNAKVVKFSVEKNMTLIGNGTS
ncbi:hypothetical protein EWM64_g567 [Hericium alpestre]|uniref:DNA polymerase alpha/delta/epsilon subunit B domain-containing protein n=1 Tax=Hericium alpestre TaxID=135208 RepID=A0A4Z0ACL6_9AGAM|nr:hypothetical protein EWM64_g567 [Hericium alpestre]